MPASTRVAVTGIAAGLNEAHLCELFSACGTIVSLQLTGAGTASARCTIVFASASAAKTATALHNTVIGDSAIYIQLMEAPPSLQATTASAASLGSTPPPPLPNRSSIVANELQRTIYLGNLAPATEASHIIGFFSGIGPVKNLKIVSGGGTTSLVRFAFVEFEEASHAAAAFQMSGRLLLGRPVRVGQAENPISAITGVPALSTQLQKRSEALDKVKEAQRRLEEKILKRRQAGNEADDEDRDSRSDPDAPEGTSAHKKRSRRTRSGSRSRSRSRRRSHQSGRSGRPRRSRSRDRQHRRRGPSPRGQLPAQQRPRRRKPKPVKDEHEGKFWDGFEWLDQPSRPFTGVGAPTATAAKLSRNA